MLRLYIHCQCKYSNIAIHNNHQNSHINIKSSLNSEPRLSPRFPCSCRGTRDERTWSLLAAYPRNHGALLQLSVVPLTCPRPGDQVIHGIYKYTNHLQEKGAEIKKKNDSRIENGTIFNWASLKKMVKPYPTCWISGKKSNTTFHSSPSQLFLSKSRS